MNKKINIIQFLPYFPPHKGGLETHAEEWGKWWVKKWYGEVYNVVTDFDQDIYLGDDEYEEIFINGEEIWYRKDWCDILVVPSIELISNFPVYKVWSKKYKVIKMYLESKINASKLNKEEQFMAISRTRFFTTSFVWWLFARKNKIKWTHVEHGSDYVKLSNVLKNVIAKVYDRIIWKWIFKNADGVVWVSRACREFIQKEFGRKEVSVIYRWFDFVNIDLNEVKEENLKEKYEWKIIVWFIWRLYKWKNIESLIKAYYLLDSNLKDKIQIVIVWDWEDLKRLNSLDIDNKIYFAGWKLFKNALKLQSQYDIHFHTSSPWWWLAGTLVQWMNFANIVISTPYEWAKEIVVDKKNWILLKDDSVEEMKRWLQYGIEQFWNKVTYLEENKKVIANEFMWEENIDKYYKLLNKWWKK